MDIKLCEYEAIDYLLGNGVCLRYYQSFKAKSEFENRWFLLSSEDEIGDSKNIVNEKIVDILLMIAQNVKDKIGTYEFETKSIETIKPKAIEIKDTKKENKKVLVIDDSATIRTYHEALLKTFSFYVDSAENGMDGLEKSLHKSYDLILCDINMPIMDGFEFIKKFRKNDKETPVIFITTLDSATDRKKGLLAGANLYIVKPIDLDILREILNSISK